MSLQDTPNAVRLHIGIFGERNSGKSALLNAVTEQRVSTVSPMVGTTTDPVVKAMEFHGLGPVVFYDTAGFDDKGELENLRIKKTVEITQRTDMTVPVLRDMDISRGMTRCKKLKEKQTPVLYIRNQDAEDGKVYADMVTQIEKKTDSDVLITNMKKLVTDDACQALTRLFPSDFMEEAITGHLVRENDLVLLIMPQGIQALRGRSILPQVQTIRDLLDHKCIIQNYTSDTLDMVLSALSKPPKLIITDLQVFPLVYEKKPEEGLLILFSILLMKYKGDIQYFIKSVKAIDQLAANSRVLVAEARTHAPFAEGIDRIKILAMLKKKYGDSLQVDIVSGVDFPKELQNYDFIIHYGVCIFSRKYVQFRVEQAKKEGIPTMNYGAAIAYMRRIPEHNIH